MIPQLFLSGLLASGLLHAQSPDEAYAAFSSRVDEALGVRPGAMIADIGTGPSITQPLRIAEKVGSKGKVVCVDITSSVIAKIKDQIALHHATNIDVVLGKEDDPLLTPGTFDAILVSNTYHEFTQPVVMLQHLAAALKPNGKLVVVELYSAGIRANLGHMALTERAFTIPEIIFVAGTRVALGVGFGLVTLARRAAGIVSVGVPAAMFMFWTGGPCAETQERRAVAPKGER